MTTFYYQPQASEVGKLPSIFSSLGIGSPWPDIQVVDAGGGTYVLRFVGTAYGPSRNAVLSGAGTPGVFADGEVYVKLKMAEWAILSAQVRSGGAGSSSALSTYYSASLDGRGSGNIRLKDTALNAGSFIRDNEILTKGSAVGVFLHLMVKASGTTISVKMWKDGESEPAYSTYTDSTLTSGYAALMTGEGTSDIYFIGVGTGTDAAPRSAGGGNAAPTFPGPNIGNQTGTVGTALTANNVASKFADSDALTFSAVGSWPPGVTVSSAGVISGTPTTAGTYSGLAVRATDTAAQTVDSDTFSFTIGAAAHLITVANSQQVNTGSSAAVQQAGNGTITLPALKDWGTGNLKANETGVTIIINNATTGVLVALLTGQTANASGVLPTMTGLVSGTAYRVTTILADGSEGTWKYTAS